MCSPSPSLSSTFSLHGHRHVSRGHGDLHRFARRPQGGWIYNGQRSTDESNAAIQRPNKQTRDRAKDIQLQVGPFVFPFEPFPTGFCVSCVPSQRSPRLFSPPRPQGGPTTQQTAKDAVMRDNGRPKRRTMAATSKGMEAWRHQGMQQRQVAKRAAKGDPRTITRTIANHREPSREGFAMVKTDARARRGGSFDPNPPPTNVLALAVGDHRGHPCHAWRTTLDCGRLGCKCGTVARTSPACMPLGVSADLSLDAGRC